MSVKLCLSGGEPVLVVGTVGGVQVWEPTAGTRLASITLPQAKPPPPDRMPYAIGFTIVPREDGTSVLIAGTSSGALHAIEADKYRFVYTEVLPSSHAYSIAGAARREPRSVPCRGKRARGERARAGWMGCSPNGAGQRSEHRADPRR
jgi:hypothetical protein